MRRWNFKTRTDEVAKLLIVNLHSAEGVGVVIEGLGAFIPPFRGDDALAFAHEGKTRR